MAAYEGQGRCQRGETGNEKGVKPGQEEEDADGQEDARRPVGRADPGGGPHRRLHLGHDVVDQRRRPPVAPVGEVADDQHPRSVPLCLPAQNSPERAPHQSRVRRQESPRWPWQAARGPALGAGHDCTFTQPEHHGAEPLCSLGLPGVAVRRVERACTRAQDDPGALQHHEHSSGNWSARTPRRRASAPGHLRQHAQRSDTDDRASVGRSLTSGPMPSRPRGELVGMLDARPIRLQDRLWPKRERRI